MNDGTFYRDDEMVDEPYEYVKSAKEDKTKPMNYKLFNKKYIYLEWDDKLEGKDCILAKKYQDLKDFVNSGDEDRIFKVNKGTEKPFTNHCSECDFCYFDPNLAVKKSLLEGKKVQYWSSFDKWEDLNLAGTCNIEDYLNNEDWDKYEWRIKPSEVKKEYYVTLDKFFEKNVFCVSDFSFDKYVFHKGTKDECEEWVNEHKGTINVMRAWLNDETIQFYDKDGKAWITINNPKWDKDFEYRVKPKEFTHRMTNRELAEYLAKGNGEMKTVYFSLHDFKFISSVYTSYNYVEGTENEEISDSIRIRDFGSDKWEEPLVEME